MLNLVLRPETPAELAERRTRAPATLYHPRLVEGLLCALHGDTTQAEALAARAGKQNSVVLAEHVRGAVRERGGDLAGALKTYEAAALIARGSGNRLALAWIQRDLMRVCLRLTRFTQLIDLAGDTETIYQDLDLPKEQISVMAALAIVYQFAGQIGKAVQKYQAAKALFDAASNTKQFSDHRLKVTILLIGATLEKSQHHYLKALEQAQTALATLPLPNAVDNTPDIWPQMERQCELLLAACYLELKYEDRSAALLKKLSDAQRKNPLQDPACRISLLRSVHELVFGSSALTPDDWIRDFKKLHDTGAWDFCLEHYLRVLHQLSKTQTPAQYDKIVKGQMDILVVHEKALPPAYRHSFIQQFEFRTTGANHVSLHYLLTKLIEIGRELMSEHDSGALVKKVLRLLIDFTQMERGFILLPSQEELVAAAVHQIVWRDLKNKHNANAACFELAKSTFEKGQELCNTDLVKSDLSDDFVVHHERLKELMVRSVIVWPFTHNGIVLGAVYLDSQSRCTADVEYLKNLAIMVGIALHNANTMTSTQRVLLHAKRLIEEQKADPSKNFSYQNFIGSSTKARELILNVRKVADSRATVVLTGESGVGKEMIAKIMHYNSPRRSEPFVAINCGAIPEGLLESELFGHERGAFTGATASKRGLFEQANNGTLFLDEISALPLPMQAKILRVLQECELSPIGSDKVITVDTRIICATNRVLEEMVQKGTFREDLYYRIMVVSITIPSLRERKEDIPLFVNHALMMFGKENRVEPKTISPQALNTMIAYPWPGNVRELYNVIQNLSLLVVGPRIELRDIEARQQLFQGVGRKDPNPQDGLNEITHRIDEGSLTLPQAKAEFERLQIERALQVAGGQITAASAYLQMPRPQVSRLVKKYRIARPTP